MNNESICETCELKKNTKETGYDFEVKGSERKVPEERNNLNNEIVMKADHEEEDEEEEEENTQTSDYVETHLVQTTVKKAGQSNFSIRKLSETKLTSFGQHRYTVPSHSFQTKLPIKKCKNENIKRTADNCSNGSQISKDTNHLECLTSPESILDNVLSAASSLSVHSSTISSYSVAAEIHASKKTTENVIMDSKIPISNKSIIITTKPSIPIKKTASATRSLQAVHTKTLSHPGSRNIVNNSHLPQSITSIEPFQTAINRSSGPSLPYMNKTLPVNTLADDLICNICNELYTDPRTLNCLHTFCLQCLMKQLVQDADTNIDNNTHGSKPITKSEPSTASTSNVSATTAATISGKSLKKKSVDKVSLKTFKGEQTISKNEENLTDKESLIRCKICQHPTKLINGGLPQLPQNFLIIRKLEEIHLKQSELVINRIWCSLCYEESNATYHCVSCTINLCTLCKEAHERQRLSAKHKIENILELRRMRHQQQQQQKQQQQHQQQQRTTQLHNENKNNLICLLHPDYVMKYFCRNCLQVVCSHCITLWHKNHRHDVISKVATYYIQILKDTAEKTQSLYNCTEHSIQKLNDIVKNIKRKCDDIEKEIDTFMNNYFKALDVHRKTLLQQVQKARESKVDMILEQQLDLEKRTEDVLRVMKFTKELTETGSDVEILMLLKLLMKRLEYCQQFKTPIDPKIYDTLHFLPSIRAPCNKTQYDIPLYGIITMQTVEPTLCTLEWGDFSQLRLNRKVDLTIISRDADNVPLCHGGSQIKCKIKYKDVNNKFLLYETQDNRDGTYTITFTPDSPGTLLLTITINDKPIKDSPYSFLVRAVRPHTGIYHCCAFCSSGGKKMIKCSCDGRMPGYMGCGHGHPGHPGRRHWSCCGNILANSECHVANKQLYANQ